MSPAFIFIRDCSLIIANREGGGGGGGGAGVQSGRVYNFKK